MSTVQFHGMNGFGGDDHDDDRDHVIELGDMHMESEGVNKIPKPVTTSIPSEATHPDVQLPPMSMSMPGPGLGLGLGLGLGSASSSGSGSGSLPLPLPPNPLAPGTSTRDLTSAKATTLAISAFKTPKNTILILVKAGLAKAQLSILHIFLLGLMAGVYVSIGSLVMTIIAGGLSGEQIWSTSTISTQFDDITNHSITTTSTSTTKYFLPAGLQRLIQASVFPLALIPVILAGAELFTSNVMFGLAAFYGRKTTLSQMLRHWGTSYLGNFLGSVMFSFLLVYLTELTHSNPIRAWLHSVVFYKTHQGWGIMVLKGIGCNMLVCLAVWQALVAEDVAGKILGIWWPIFGFIAIGFEHSIANMFLAPLALMTGLDVNFGDFLAWNLIPVTIGNILGGGFFITIQWLVFHEHLQQQLIPLTVKAGYKVPSPFTASWVWILNIMNHMHAWTQHTHTHTPTQTQMTEPTKQS